MPDRTVTQWTDDVFKVLYQKSDADRTPVDLWTAAYAHFSTMGEAIRKVHFKELMSEATHAFCWVCSFVLGCQSAKNEVFWLDESLSSAVSLKYPDCCGHCKKDPCYCNPMDKEGARNKDVDYPWLADQRRKLLPAQQGWSLQDWRDLFVRLYGPQIHHMSLETVGFHFLEEAGEAAKAVRSLQQLSGVTDEDLGESRDSFLLKLSKVGEIVKLYEQYKNIDINGQMHKDEPDILKARLVKGKIEMVAEVADTFSWFCSVLTKVFKIAENCSGDPQDKACHIVGRTFEELLQDEYMRDGTPQCHACGQSPCSCVFKPLKAKGH
jgi:hypothetical protein